MRNIRLRLGVTAALLSLASVSAAAQTRPDGDYWRHPYMMGDGGWLAMIFGLREERFYAARNDSAGPIRRAS